MAAQALQGAADITKGVSNIIPTGPQDILNKIADQLPSRNASGDKLPPVPSPWAFLFYALFLPISPAAQAIAGDNGNALTRLLYLTIIPFGFIFGLLATINDYYCMMFDPRTFFLKGSQRFSPFTWIGWEKDGNSPNIVLPQEKVSCAPETFAQTVSGLIKAPLIAGLPALELAAQFNPTAATALSAMKTALGVPLTAAHGAVAITAGSLDAAAAAAKQVEDKITLAANTATAAASLATQGADAIGIQSTLGSLQRGGSISTSDSQTLTTFDTVILMGIAALIGGSAILTAGRQYVRSTRPSDSPPLPGRV
jgi:hypothetical protein